MTDKQITENLLEKAYKDFLVFIETLPIEEQNLTHDCYNRIVNMILKYETPALNAVTLAYLFTMCEMYKNIK
jgi:hypothetical protein